MKRRMRGLSILLAACLLTGLLPVQAFATGGNTNRTGTSNSHIDITTTATPVQGLTIDKLSTRSGPGTEYRETGTYKVKDTYVRIISYAYDRGNVCWLQCEVSYGGKLRRIYTGLKRFDATSFSLSSVPFEEDLGDKVKVLKTSKAMYGPGSGYATYDKLTVDKGQSVYMVMTENDYALVEWKTTKQSYRAWVPINSLDW